jgi:site-specific DNA-methyltransferase (adenine-specific)
MTTETFLDGRVTLHSGDCLDVLARLDECSIDSVVTDPPYHLTSIVKRFGAEDAAPAKGGVYNRSARGFMGKQWDGGEIAFDPETWAAVMRVLKPGGHLLAFGAPKNFGFMQYAIAHAGFEIRDVLAWMFGSGFPKSHNQPGGWGTALKPAYEPIIMGRKALVGTVARNIELHGTGAINIDGCRVGTEERLNLSASSNEIYGQFKGEETEGRMAVGRWPANVLHDGSDEVVGAFPESGPPCGSAKKSTSQGWIAGSPNSQAGSNAAYVGDTGNASRFFYTAKADSDDRLGSRHPTVKPLDLMQWLVRLVTPKNGTVLDCFAGTGTTGEAAWREGMNAVLIEREPEYQDDIRRRMKLAMGGPEERARESIKAKNLPMDAGPLFNLDAAE